MPWTEANKIDAFSMCLRKEASEYFSILSAQVRSSFDEIKTKFEAHFEKTDVPSTIRWELLAVEQREDEPLERFLTRLQKMIISAYPDTAQQELNCAMFIEAFLKGCRDKHSALAAGLFCLFGVLRRFQHCTGHITTGSWKGRGNQYI